ncbi:hypothetical protein [Variovorax boronicumulans]|uniref:hypothetical protein n=1 Tax=Variovorax boronicumulans TaxID=436515 RepID=UPI00078493A0|nr:hypothetical protein [Variovorax boronicumulans]
MRVIGADAGQRAVHAGPRPSALLFQWPGNVRAMAGTDLDTETAALRTSHHPTTKRPPLGKVNGWPHLVPLAILEASRVPTWRGRFVPSSLLTGGRCASRKTVRSALRRRGYANDNRTAPEFRVMASGRAEFMARHRQLMTSWAAYLDRLRGGTGDHVPEGMPPVNPLFCWQVASRVTTEKSVFPVPARRSFSTHHERYSWNRIGWNIGA